MKDIPVIENQAGKSKNLSLMPCSQIVKTNRNCQVLNFSLKYASERDSKVRESKKFSCVRKTLSPLLDASKKRLSVRKRRTKKREILTSSPFKNELKE